MLHAAFRDAALVCGLFSEAPRLAEVVGYGLPGVASAQGGWVLP